MSNVPVLMYHHISPSSGSLTTTPANFASQMDWLQRKGWHTLSSEEFAAFARGERVPDKSVLLTFDDGYLDNYVYAHPVLKARGMRATMFLVTDWIHDGPPRATTDSVCPPPPTPGHAQCKETVAAGLSDEVIVRWSEVDAMRQAGTFDFQCHTHTHTRWDIAHANDRAAKRQGLAQDLDRSQSSLRGRLGSTSSQLCWPQGYFDADYLEIGADAGFEIFYTTDARGHNHPGRCARHVHRVAVKNKGGMMFGWRLSLAHSETIGTLYNRMKR